MASTQPFQAEPLSDTVASEPDVGHATGIMPTCLYICVALLIVMMS